MKLGISEEGFYRLAQSFSTEEYPLAGAEVDGLIVGDSLDNTDSISASLNDYTILEGIREIPLSAFDVTSPYDLYYASNDIKHTKELAEKIRQSNMINPLIVVKDAEGLYVLEGGHRLGALHLLGKGSLPALLVIDDESLDIEQE